VGATAVILKDLACASRQAEGRLPGARGMGLAAGRGTRLAGCARRIDPGVDRHWSAVPVGLLGSYGISAPTADRAHSALMLRARMSLPHFSVSSAMSLPKSAGESASTSPPRLASRALILGSARPALISLLSMSMISPACPWARRCRTKCSPRSPAETRPQSVCPAARPSASQRIRRPTGTTRALIKSTRVAARKPHAGTGQSRCKKWILVTDITSKSRFL